MYVVGHLVMWYSETGQAPGEDYENAMLVSDVIIFDFLLDGEAFPTSKQAV